MVKLDIIVAPDNPRELAEVIGMLLSDPALRRRMGMAGRNWVETEMNWDRAARQMETALGLDDNVPPYPIIDRRSCYRPRRCRA